MAHMMNRAYICSSNIGRLLREGDFNFGLSITLWDDEERVSVWATDGIYVGISCVIYTYTLVYVSFAETHVSLEWFDTNITLTETNSKYYNYVLTCLDDIKGSSIGNNFNFRSYSWQQKAAMDRSIF